MLSPLTPEDSLYSLKKIKRETAKEMVKKVSNWDKFKILLWKNWILQWNHKFQLVIEILLPVLFVLLLLWARSILKPEKKAVKTYSPIGLNDLSLYNKELQETRTDKIPKLQLLYSPNTKDAYKEIMETASKTLQLNAPQGYANAADLEFALVSGNYLAGVQIHDSDAYPKKFSYSIRFPSELRTSKDEIWHTNQLSFQIKLPGPRNDEDEDGGTPVGYLREGFLPIQNAIAIAHLNKNKANQKIVLPNIMLQRYPYPEFLLDVMVWILSMTLPLFINLSYLYPALKITKFVTYEKEMQLKEVMKIMGLQNWIHWAAWFVKSFFLLGISTLLITVLMMIKWDGDCAMFTFSSFTVVIFFMLMYVTASICFCFLMATLFSKSSTAAAVTGFIWFLTYLPYMMASFNTANWSGIGPILAGCLLCNSAMGYGLHVILTFEISGEGAHWGNLFSPMTLDTKLTLGYVILMMLVSCIICMLLCLYFEQVCPGEFAVARKWNFPFTASFWCRTNEYTNMEDNSNDEGRRDADADAFEEEPSGKKVGVQVKNLQKQFGDKTVVKGISMNMYEDEIIVLLGHNGAGKTTFIFMLIGMIRPTAGTAIIDGSDIRTNLMGARTSLGICPQHNVLFDDMSVANHLVFFSRSKGLKGAAVKKEVDKYLKLIALEDKANEVTSSLSGGMKRKLSVCCALCGGTKVVLCDEPTSGMDPSARRQLWDLIQAEKTGRTILLTTHFMDEADALSDRIAIMCDGELKCNGTSFFLKNKYGSGYNLICVKLEKCNTAEVTALLEQYIPGIVPESDIGTELSYKLPNTLSTVFEEMFRALEDKSEELHLGGYGISITSIEEVFMKVGAETASSKQQSAITNGASENPEDDIESIHSDRMFSENTRMRKGKKLCLYQWQAMFLKKFKYTIRNKILFIFQNVFAIYSVLNVLISAAMGKFQEELPPMTMSVNQYPRVVVVLDANYSALNPLSTDIADYYKKIVKSYGSNHEIKTTKDESFSNYILKLGKTIQAFINSQYLAAASINDDTIVAWLNNQPLHTAPLTVNLVHNAMAKALIEPGAEIVITNSPLPFTTETLMNNMKAGTGYQMYLVPNIVRCMCFICALYALFLIRERESRPKLLQFVSGLKIWIFWLSHLLWDYGTYMITVLIIIIIIACFQQEGLSTFSEIGRFFLILIIFGFAVLPYTYLLSYWFTEPTNGFVRIALLNLLMGLVVFTFVSVLSSEGLKTKETMEKCKWIFLIFPHFCLASCITKLFENEQTREICSKDSIVNLPDDLRCEMVPECCKTTPYFSWKKPGVSPELVYMITTGVVNLLILMMLDYRLLGWLFSSLKKKKTRKAKNVTIDDDVQNEKQRIIEMTKNDIAEQNLVLDRVTKYYHKFRAVNQISLCVKQTECFGLLGINGAGKTTLFKILTGDIPITSGKVYVKGISLEKDINSIYKEIGYCPQFDALFDDLTGRETLKIFCLVRGIQKDSIPQVSDELGKAFGFMKHMDKRTKAYSGGNKRKLCTAIAVLGSPSVIYLDEPTTGMDPGARRHLWNVLIRIRDSGKSIVLTSHSMEECEALCTRLAIMVNGEFKCIGAIQHLKNKFSKGLVLKIKVKRSTDQQKQVSESNEANDGERKSVQVSQPEIEKVKQFVQEEFPESNLAREYQGILIYYIPLESIKWSEIFGLMEDNRDGLNIEDYSISQTTLEEIFLEFGKHQKEIVPTSN